MKIAFVGKGGSGKTTLSSLFSRYLSTQHVPVIAIDADINTRSGATKVASDGQVTFIIVISLTE